MVQLWFFAVIRNYNGFKMMYSYNKEILIYRCFVHREKTQTYLWLYNKSSNKMFSFFQCCTPGETLIQKEQEEEDWYKMMFLELDVYACMQLHMNGVMNVGLLCAPFFLYFLWETFNHGIVVFMSLWTSVFQLNGKCDWLFALTENVRGTMFAYKGANF